MNGMNVVYAIHTSYRQPYTYDGEHHSCHSVILFSTLQRAQAFVDQAQKQFVEMEVITLDDPNSRLSWIQNEN